MDSTKEVSLTAVSQQPSVVRGMPVSSTTSIVYEPVLTNGGFLASIKYKYDVNIMVGVGVPYVTTMFHKVHSHLMGSQEDMDTWIGTEVLSIHKAYPAAKITSIDVVRRTKG